MHASPAPPLAPTATARPDPLDDVLAADLIALRRALHRRPELGFEEHDTSAALRVWLSTRGFRVGPPLATTGFSVDIVGAHPGPTVGYRADMDALPIDEASEVPYRSENPGAMHACGHDAHMAIACGVAVLADARRDQMHGTLRVFFQPNEESAPSGAPVMIEDGVLDGLSAVYAVHVDPALAVGRVGVREGTMLAACAPFVVTLSTTASGHSARPHEGADTVWIATTIAQQLYALAGRVSDARRPAVLTLCRFHAGDALNVVPAHVEFGGTLRAVDLETMTVLREAIRRIVGSAGAVYNVEADVRFLHVLPAVVNAPEETDRAERAARDLYGPDAVFRMPLPSMGGEDFAYYLERVPGTMVRVGSSSGSSTRYPLHHPRFDVDEAVIPFAARLMTEVCLRDLAERAG